MGRYFCDECGYQLTEMTSSGKLSFYCYNCYKAYDSKPEDTLLFEISFHTDESKQKYSIMEMNAPFDEAGFKVAKECPECGMPYMTRVYVSEDMLVVYRCECGYSEGATKDIKKK